MDTLFNLISVKFATESVAHAITVLLVGGIITFLLKFMKDKKENEKNLLNNRLDFLDQQLKLAHESLALKRDKDELQDNQGLDVFKKLEALSDEVDKLSDYCDIIESDIEEDLQDKLNDLFVDLENEMDERVDRIDQELSDLNTKMNQTRRVLAKRYKELSDRLKIIECFRNG